MPRYIVFDTSQDLEIGKGARVMYVNAYSQRDALRKFVRKYYPESHHELDNTEYGGIVDTFGGECIALNADDIQTLEKED